MAMAVSDVVCDASPYSGSDLHIELPAISGPGQAEVHVPENVEQVQSSRREGLLPPCYDMAGDKILIIFNHYKYNKTRHYRHVPKTRHGTYEDVKSLENTFRRFGFIVVTHDDWRYKDIIRYLSQVCNNDHSHTSCLAVAVMTHGEGSDVCASDQQYPISDITQMVGTAPNLDGKPKLFFIQACRAGHTSPRRGEEDISIGADCLLLYSTYEDYVSYRNENTGTWLMQALCLVLNTHHRSLDLSAMAILVNSAVADETTVFGDKQMSVAEYKLKKRLML